MMGAFQDEVPFEDEEKPGHGVCLSSYYLQETEVTIGEFSRFCKNNGLEDDPATRDFYDQWKSLASWKNVMRKEKFSDHPAAGISHKMAEKYARSVGGELPSEAQWEFAARSRGKPQRYVWGDERDGRSRKANVCNPDDGSNEVKDSYPEDRTEQGVWGLTGNVREWCRDPWLCYSPRVTECDPVAKAKEGGQPIRYAIRGGSYATPPETARATWRSDVHDAYPYKATDDVAFPDVGFRLVVEVLICEPKPSAKRDSTASLEAGR
jgi:formylglycine-generating enzyme required for sulfatase activity